MYRLLLHYMPPSRIGIPSAGLSVLKGFLNDNGIPSTIIYWNVLFKDVQREYTGSEDISLIPFFYKYALDRNDTLAFERLRGYLSRREQFLINRSSDDLLTIAGRWYDEIHSIILAQLKSLHTDGELLCGISAKHFAWIPGIILGRIIRSVYPDSKLIIGGLDTPEAAAAIMKASGCFNFAIWGEGEMPLLELYSQIQQQKQEFDRIPNLLFRSNGTIKQSGSILADGINLECFYRGKFDDFFEQIKNKHLPKVEIPVESSRGCFWGKCNFCTMNEGVCAIRRRSVDIIIAEMQDSIERYGEYKFRFTDSSTNSGRSEFTELLDRLISLNRESENKIKLFAEITPFQMDAAMVEKMVLAGFERVQIGFEALADSAMQKLNKLHRFADNLLFVKFALKYGVYVSTSNIITGFPNESEEDIIESKKNLGFLRYFIKKNTYQLVFNGFRLEKNSSYEHALSPDETAKYTDNTLKNLLPESFISDEGCPYLFAYRGQSKLQAQWDDLQNDHQKYVDHAYSYHIIQGEDGIYRIEEFVDSILVKTIVLDQEIYVDILRLTDERIMKFKTLLTTLAEKYEYVTEEKLNAAISFLSSNFLVYANAKKTQIFSVIDFSSLSEN